MNRALSRSENLTIRGDLWSLALSLYWEAEGRRRRRMLARARYRHLNDPPELGCVYTRNRSYSLIYGLLGFSVAALPI